MSEPIWIEDALVFAIHDRQLAEHGGAAGLRDESLLHSALGRPQNHLAYAGADIIHLAAGYTFGIVKNHPFVDGNKRTGFIVGVLFLELNAYRFTASEAAAAQAVLELAAGTIDEVGFCDFLRANVDLLTPAQTATGYPPETSASAHAADDRRTPSPPRAPKPPRDP